MGRAKKRPSILQRERAQQHEERPAKKPKRDIVYSEQQREPQGTKAAAASTERKRQDGGRREPRGLRPASVVHSQAAYAVRRLLEADASKAGGVTLKSLTLAPHVEAKKATYAVTCETLRHLPVLQPLLEHTQLAEAGAGLPRHTALVLAFELLLGEGLRPTGPAERAVLQRKSELQAALQQLLSEAGVSSSAELLPAAGPATPHARAARVNTLRSGVEEALSWLRAPPPQHRKWAALGQRAQRDALLPDVLLFPPGCDLHDHPLVASGTLVLQSRASCMPAHALRPQPGWHVVDACAAPGNKTTHLAALMGNNGTITAFEKDPRRLQRLQANATSSGGTIIRPRLADFLAMDPQAPEWAGVSAVLLDPSCSGSGTAFTRMDFLLPSSADRLRGEAAVLHSDERVEGLARFQQACILHALRFPALRRLVYSTCSVHARENEGVVAAVLPEAAACGFRLEQALPAWPRRGAAGLVEGAEKLVRVDPDEDGTDGFFVAVFAREDAGAGGGTNQEQQERRSNEKKKRKQAAAAASNDP